MLRRAFLAILVLATLGLPPVEAQRYPRAGSQVVPLEQVLPQIRHSYPGTFSDAEGPYPDEYGNPHYHIKWLTPEGRVVWLDTDARTGRVIGVNGSGWRTQQYRADPRGYGGQYNGPYNAPYNGGRAAGYPPPPNRGAPPPNWGGGGNYRGGYPRGGYPAGGHWGGAPHGGSNRNRGH
ncbi:MAG TPA: PepSY domain-containing protein [Rhizomicrobium sp.]|jgi:hypothetical protein